jgi:hypothetical protein
MEPHLDAKVFVNWALFSEWKQNCAIGYEAVVKGPFCTSMEIIVGPDMPDNEIQFRDRAGERVLARLTNIGSPIS